MNTRRTYSFGGDPQQAFTLIELLVVMAIMAILLAVSIPAISGLNESNNIAQAGQSLADEIALARQTASSRNLTIEIRCINVPSLSLTGYSAVQLWVPSTGLAASRVLKLPDGIAISQDTTSFSPLFGTYQSAGIMPVSSPLAGDTYVAFTINPSGMLGPLSTTTATPDMKTLTVGVVPARLATATTLASTKNYMLVQLNPLTAATLNYRP